MPKIYPVHVGHEYQHYKSKRKYKILHIAEDAETGVVHVVYRAQYGEGKTFFRPLSRFNDFVDKNGHRGPRFMEVKHDRLTKINL